jgi:hypothetical protein
MVMPKSLLLPLVFALTIPSPHLQLEHPAEERPVVFNQNSIVKLPVTGLVV